MTRALGKYIRQDWFDSVLLAYTDLGRPSTGGMYIVNSALTCWTDLQINLRYGLGELLDNMQSLEVARLRR